MMNTSPTASFVRTLRRGSSLAAFVLLAAAPAPVWLDAQTLANWNVAGAALPAAPPTKDAELAAGGRCASTLRPPSTPEDRAAVQKGWSLIGPYQRYGHTSVLLVTSSTDGMCRPNGYQGFVFVDDTFAGTVSPNVMDSRSDASISGLGVNLYNERSFGVTFARYSESDALCCPHASTSVSYDVRKTDGGFVVVPLSAQMTKNLQ